MSNPTPVVIEAVQYTPGRDAVMIQFAAKDPAHPLLGQSRQITTTQPALGGGDWGDDPIIAALVDRLSEWGISAVVVANDAPAPPAPGEEDEAPQP